MVWNHNKYEWSAEIHNVRPDKYCENHLQDRLRVEKIQMA